MGICKVFMMTKATMAVDHAYETSHYLCEK